MKKFFIATAISAMLATSAMSGGPVIIEETEVAPAHDRKVPAWVFLALGAVVVAAIAGGGSDACTTEEPVEPPAGPVC